MRKVRYLFFICLISCSLIGCEQKQEKNEELYQKLKEYKTQQVQSINDNELNLNQINFNGKTISLPCSINSLKTVEIKSENKKELESGKYLFHEPIKIEDTKLKANFWNDNLKKTNINNCKLFSLEIKKTENISFVNEITFSDSKKIIKEKMNNYEDVLEYKLKGIDILQYTINKDTINSCSIIFEFYENELNTVKIETP